MGTRGVVIRRVAMEDEGEDEGGRAVADNNGVDMGWNRPDSHVIRVCGALSLMKKDEE